MSQIIACSGQFVLADCVICDGEHNEWFKVEPDDGSLDYTVCRKHMDMVLVNGVPMSYDDACHAGGHHTSTCYDRSVYPPTLTCTRPGE